MNEQHSQETGMCPNTWDPARRGGGQEVRGRGERPAQPPGSDDDAYRPRGLANAESMFNSKL